ncbi:precorrin-3B C(17)-methyltransferase, partial [Prochlorococcus sp. AH-716-M18]|nr:precorrin-3B C(17)-methyltransferase [Prochlorococcus sp. AH-716-M18]
NQRFLNLDSFGNQWGWKRSGNIQNWSKIVIKQAKNEEIFCKQLSGNCLWQTSESGKIINQIHEKETENPDSTFHVSVFENNKITWHPPVLWIGIGCARNTSKELIANSLNNFLNSGNLSPQSIAGFATIDIKKDEQGILELAEEKKLPIKFFSKEELSEIIVPNPSNVVQKEIGTPSVAEASCLMAAGEKSKLLKEKRIFKNQTGSVTIAIAQSMIQYYPTNGEIHIIGSGPGDISFLTNNARKALSRCTVWIGYKMYLDLIKTLKRSDQVLLESKLTQEKERCIKAIKLAEEGIKVALISSGESGFYGMAGLLLELLQKIKKEYRPYFEVHPGISSVQLAAAISGAPLMNDFCSISLSDKLTPWSLIEKRIEGALLGDFVIALFNPQSIERNWQLQSALDLCLKSRQGDTPVLIARQVGRKNQSKKFFTLSTIPINEIDMLSIIIIGNSQTTLVDEIFLTPRGYLQN